MESTQCIPCFNGSPKPAKEELLRLLLNEQTGLGDDAAMAAMKKELKKHNVCLELTSGQHPPTFAKAALKQWYNDDMPKLERGMDEKEEFVKEMRIRASRTEAQMDKLTDMMNMFLQQQLQQPSAMSLPGYSLSSPSSSDIPSYPAATTTRLGTTKATMAAEIHSRDGHTFPKTEEGRGAINTIVGLERAGEQGKQASDSLHVMFEELLGGQQPAIERNKDSHRGQKAEIESIKSETISFIPNALMPASMKQEEGAEYSDVIEKAVHLHMDKKAKLLSYEDFKEKSEDLIKTLAADPTMHTKMVQYHHLVVATVELATETSWPKARLVYENTLRNWKRGAEFYTAWTLAKLENSNIAATGRGSYTRERKNGRDRSRDSYTADNVLAGSSFRGRGYQRPANVNTAAAAPAAGRGGQAQH